MSQKPTPSALYRQGNSYYLPVLVRSYVELAQLQRGLIAVLQELRDVEPVNNEGIYWVSRVLQSTIHSADYEILDQLNKQ